MFIFTESANPVFRFTVFSPNNPVSSNPGNDAQVSHPILSPSHLLSNTLPVSITAHRTVTDAIHKAWLCWKCCPMNTTPDLFVCLSGLLEEAPPFPRTLKLPLKRAGWWVSCAGMEVESKEEGGGGWQANDWEDPLLLGSSLPVDSSQCHRPLPSNQWVWLNRLKDTKNR